MVKEIFSNQVITKKENVSTFLILLFYGAGLLGILATSTRDLFLLATPINLFLSAIILLWNHLTWNRSFLFYSVVALLTGMLVEIIGVQTGVIFGTYEYGQTLGYKIANVPIVIGLNWLVCSYCCGVIANQLKVNIFLKAMIGAFLMVALDYVIEPTAMKMDFWSWANNQVPILNYIAWYVISFALLLLFFTLPFAKKNNIAIILYITQWLFFFCIDIVLGLFIF